MSQINIHQDMQQSAACTKFMLAGMNTVFKYDRGFVNGVV